MKMNFAKGIALAGLAVLTLPAFSQDDKKDVQTIVITRTGDTTAKTVVEIQGNKVTVNGKEASGSDDVRVMVHSNSHFPVRVPGFSGTTVYSPSFFTEDANRAMLGVVTEEGSKGAVINMVSKDSPAEKAGLKKGDVITRIGNQPIKQAGDISKVIRENKPGDKVSVTYLRDGKEQKVTAELDKWKGIQVHSAPELRALTEQRFYEGMVSPSITFSGSRPKLGMSVQDTEDGKGVLITEVEDDGNAAKSGLRKGDIITHIEGNETNNVDAVRRHTMRSNLYVYKFTVLRNGKTQEINLKIPRKLKTADL